PVGQHRGEEHRGFDLHEHRCDQPVRAADAECGAPAARSRPRGRRGEHQRLEQVGKRDGCSARRTLLLPRPPLRPPGPPPPLHGWPPIPTTPTSAALYLGARPPASPRLRTGRTLAGSTGRRPRRRIPGSAAETPSQEGERTMSASRIPEDGSAEPRAPGDASWIEARVDISGRTLARIVFAALLTLAAMWLVVSLG